MRFVKALVMFVAFAFAATTVVGISACKKEEPKKEAKKDEAKKDEAPAPAEPTEPAKTEPVAEPTPAPTPAPAADAWGEKCKAYFAEFDKLCATPANDMIKTTCDASKQAIDGMKAMPPADPTTAAALETSCEAGAQGLAAVANAPAMPAPAPAAP